MKSITIYYANKKLSPMHDAHFYPGGMFFLRVEVTEGDVTEALDKAKPMEGEILLNTVAMPGQTE